MLKKALVGLFIATILSSCSSFKQVDPITGEEDYSNAVKAGLAGGTTGVGVGSFAGAGGSLIGGVVGLSIGSYYGYTIDQVAKELKRDLEKLGIEVTTKDGIVNIKVSNQLMFEKSSKEISDDGKQFLDDVIKIMRKLDEYSYIIVSGHTDNTSKRMFNISMSEQRAKMVAYYLYKNEMTAKQIDYRGYADLYPVAPNDTEENRALNRRVTIEIIPESTMDKMKYMEEKRRKESEELF